MLDPFPPPPAWLRDAVKPWALSLNLPTLPEHAHEVLFAFAFYQFIHSYLSPWLSAILFKQHYPNLNQRTKLNWDVHVVSLVQSTLICLAALYVMYADRERSAMNIGERVYGYSGSCALIQALGLGYFLYDLIISSIHIKMFGVGMLFHALSAVCVFSLGFRPFLNFYSPNFLLYELSSPFLNIHWFLDKVNMTGSKAQWYNGMALLIVFFSCRLVWGTWQSACVYVDMWRALKQTWSASAQLDPVDVTAHVFQTRNGALCVNEACTRANAEVSKFSSYTAGGVPTWLVLSYVASNIVLNGLNYYWFSKMIGTVMKRFREPQPAAKKEEDVQKLRNDLVHDVVLEAAAKLEEEQGEDLLRFDLSEEKIASAVDMGLGEELRKRKANLADKIPPS